jgi:hypothetical protein
MLPVNSAHGTREVAGDLTRLVTLSMLHPWSVADTSVVVPVAESLLAGSLFVSGVQNLIGDEQPPHRLATDNVRFDDFVHIFGLHAAIPDGFGVNDDGGAEFALIEAAGFVGAHHLDAALGELGFEEALEFALAGGIAAGARMAWFALVHTNKNMLFKLGHASV